MLEGVEERASESPIVVNDVGSREELIRAYEASVRPFEEGAIILGTVVRVDADEVLLDVGYKSEGVIPAKELSVRPGVDPRQEVSVGDVVEVMVLEKEDKDGRLVLSKKRAQYERAWVEVEEAFRTGRSVRGTVIEVVKGGIIVDIGLRGFMPASLVDVKRVRDLSSLVGKEIEAKVIELDRARNNVVLSRKKHLEECESERRRSFLESLKKGEVRRGVVSSVVSFGAFVDLGGGVDGLVHVSELAWKHVEHPSEVLKVGQEVDVEVLEVDVERERISLSLRRTLEDPWQRFAREHPPGSVVTGTVTRLAGFGAFVELEEGIEGLVHISELAPFRVTGPEQVVAPGDEVRCKVLEVDPERRRISLSIRRAEEEREEPLIEAEDLAEAGELPPEDLTSPGWHALGGSGAGDPGTRE